MSSHKLLEHTAQGFLFEGGDVIIRSSNRPSGTFLVHKDVLSRKSPYLSALLSGRWNSDQANSSLSSDAKDLGQEECSSQKAVTLDLYLDFEVNLCLLTAKVRIESVIEIYFADTCESQRASIVTNSGT